jgi:hypothetical protein
MALCPDRCACLGIEVAIFSTYQWRCRALQCPDHVSFCSAQEIITMLSTLMGTIGACTSGLGGRVETRTTGLRGERGCPREMHKTTQPPLGVTHWRSCRGWQPFASLYTSVERASMTSLRIGNYAPIVIYGWRSPARSVPALYPPLGRMPVRVVG